MCRRRPRRAVLAAILAVGLLAGTVATVVGTAGSSRDRPPRLAAPDRVVATPAVAAAPTGPTPTQRAQCPPTSTACVDLGAHAAWLQRGDAVVLGPVPMLPGTDTGRRAPGPSSSATPTGSFHVQYKEADAVSSEFGEPMPNAVYFAPGGIAFHAGSLTTTSNGCIHLSAPDSETFFRTLARGDAVTVF